MKDNILYQDNKSSILLEKNGKMSSGKRTKHINVRYFFITDRASKGELSIEWCPTANMVGDFATKPLHGALFRKFRDMIMGVVPLNNKKEPRKGKESLVPQKEVPQECVGRSFKKERRTVGIGKPARKPNGGITQKKITHHGEEYSHHGEERLHDSNG